MTLQEHKRLGNSFTACPRRYKYLCREYRGSLTCVASVLWAYVFATRERGEPLPLSETDLMRLLDYDWSEKPIRAARTFLVSAGLLLHRNGERGQRCEMAVDFDLIEELEKLLPADWESELTLQLQSSSRRVGQNCRAASRSGQPRQICRGSGAKMPVAGRTTTADLPGSSLLKEVAIAEKEQKLACPAVSNPKRKKIENEVWSLFAGLEIAGSRATPQTVKALVTEIERWPEEDWPLALRKVNDARSRARTWGLFKFLVAQETAAHVAQGNVGQEMVATDPIIAPAASEAQEAPPEYDSLTIEHLKLILASHPTHSQAPEWREWISQGAVQRKPAGVEQSSAGARSAYGG